ncbi:MAG: LysR family transcriptional regulator [Pseudomonadota bacterium]
MVQDIRTLGLPALLSFHTVAKQGGISAAATHLGMAKSGVSRHIAQLEDQFGVRLLERGGRSVKLTPVGIRLDARIQSILAELDILKDIAREESAGVSGQINVAGTPEFGGLMASHLFPLIHERHPGLIFSMLPSYSFEDMQDPATDLAFRVGSVRDDRLIAKPLGLFRRLVVASPSVAARHAPQCPSDLTNLPCLAFSGDPQNADWILQSGKGTETVTVSGPYAVHSFTILKDLATRDAGFALLPEFMLTEAFAKGELVNALPQHPSREFQVFLTYRPGARRIARLNAAITLTEEFVPGILEDRRI